MKLTITQTITGQNEVKKLLTEVDIPQFDLDVYGIPIATIDAKGDLLVGTANDTVGRLGVGSNGQILSANSAQTPGVAWANQVAGTIFLLTNNDGVDHEIGTVVYIDRSGDNKCKMCTSAGDDKVCAVALTRVKAGQAGVYAQTGKATILVNGVVSIGDWLVMSAIAGRACINSSPKFRPATGAIGIATTANPNVGNATVEAILDIFLYNSA